jgi:hypothetical protein
MVLASTLNFTGTDQTDEDVTLICENKEMKIRAVKYNRPISNAHVMAQIGGFLIDDEKVVGLRWIVSNQGGCVSEDGRQFHYTLPDATVMLVDRFMSKTITSGTAIDLFVFSGAGRQYFAGSYLVAQWGSQKVVLERTGHKEETPGRQLLDCLLAWRIDFSSDGIIFPLQGDTDFSPDIILYDVLDEPLVNWCGTPCVLSPGTKQMVSPAKQPLR